MPAGASKAGLSRLKKRADFVRAARGARAQAPAFTLQAFRRTDGTVANGGRIGFTVTRKTGNAVERNRMRRRLKEAVRQSGDLPARFDHDYVLVLRRPALAEAFRSLQEQLVRSFDAVHRRQPRPERAPKGPERR